MNLFSVGYDIAKQQLRTLGVVISTQELVHIDSHIEVFILGLLNDNTEYSNKTNILTLVVNQVSNTQLYYCLGCSYKIGVYDDIAALLIMSSHDDIVNNCNEFITKYYVPSTRSQQKNTTSFGSDNTVRGMPQQQDSPSLLLIPRLERKSLEQQ